jgi:L-cysteine S-thiosulfotransferase
MRCFVISLCVALSCNTASAIDSATVVQPAFARDALRSGTEYVSAALRAQQKDDDLNPGMLWVDQGRALFERDCVACHPTPHGLATALPKLASSGSVITLEHAINICQITQVKQPAYMLESQSLLALTTFLAFSSRGTAQLIPQGVTASAAWQRAQAEFTRIQGKLDFSCRSCHDKLYGKRIRTQTISQGHGVGFPAYRVEWQTLGSLNRRLRACFFGMETSVPAASDPILADLELYLAWRAQGLLLEAPAVRR